MRIKPEWLRNVVAVVLMNLGVGTIVLLTSLPSAGVVTTLALIYALGVITLTLFGLIQSLVYNA